MFPPYFKPQRRAPISDGVAYASSIHSRDTSFKAKRSLDFTQRVEHKLAEYNASDSIYKKWLFEIVCWFISAVSLGAITGIYFHINNNKLSDWDAIITLTNVLGKVASAALILPTTEALGQLKWNWFHDSSRAIWDFEIFDKATRGPWGAAMLLFRTKGRSLAALGALLIVLLLALDSFLQQVIILPDVWALQSTHGEIPRTIQYNVDFGGVIREGMQLVVEDTDIGTVARKYFFGNETQPVPFGSGTRPDIPIALIDHKSCPTNSCTWPVHDSLGLCSQCAEVSTYLEYACIDGRVDWASDEPGGLFEIELTDPNATMCGYFFNSTSKKQEMMTGYSIDPNTGAQSEALIMRTMPMLTVLDKKPLFDNGSIKFPHIRNPIADVLIVSSADGTSASVYKKEPPVAYECVLSWCIQTIKAMYDEGAYHETILHKRINTTAAENLWVTFQVQTDYQNGTDITYTESVIVNANDSLHGNPTSFGLTNNTTYADMMPFDDMFPAFYNVKPNETEPMLRYNTWKESPAYNRPLDLNPWLAPNNVTRHMERLASAMTNIYRSVGTTNEVILGSAYSREVYIRVRWEWLVFPFALLLLTLVFLVATIVKTSNDTATGIWKTSAMPTLIYGLPKETQKKLNSSSEWKSNKTKKVRIRLLPSMGWRVSGQSFLRSSPILPTRRNQPPPGWI